METVKMTAEERKEYEAYLAEKKKKEQAEKAKADRDAYKELVEDCIKEATPFLMSASEVLAENKAKTLDTFRKAIEMKEKVFGVKSEQRSHTFTNTESTVRITVGQYVKDDYRDTVNEGISLVSAYIESLGRDENSRSLVRAVMRLLSKDQKGNLKASRVLQLRKMADESNNDKFKEGVKIIEESYQPAVSRWYVRCEKKDDNEQWTPVPLGMTEA